MPPVNLRYTIYDLRENMKMERRKQNLEMRGEVSFNKELALIRLRCGYGATSPGLLAIEGRGKRQAGRRKYSAPQDGCAGAQPYHDGVMSSISATAAQQHTRVVPPTVKE
jgi:hypothetical protein